MKIVRSSSSIRSGLLSATAAPLASLLVAQGLLDSRTHGSFSGLLRAARTHVGHGLTHPLSRQPRWMLPPRTFGDRERKGFDHQNRQQLLPSCTELSLLKLAQEMINVSRACGIVGYSRQRFYEIRRNY